MSEANKKAAAEIRAFKHAFQIAGDQIVEFQRADHRHTELIRLDDLLERLERPAPKQASLFDPNL